jgi:ABC-type nickel/cobalt efflux system permease component RcnA
LIGLLRVASAALLTLTGIWMLFSAKSPPTLLNLALTSNGVTTFLA